MTRANRGITGRLKEEAIALLRVFWNDAGGGLEVRDTHRLWIVGLLGKPAETTRFELSTARSRNS
ncbi:hypothetical protein C7G42_30125 [Bradyrhizobium sp. MOS003]|nr:hypothetical protein C7G42_30125 [Bradyrhizobium sp. MOS003]